MEWCWGDFKQTPGWWEMGWWLLMWAVISTYHEYFCITVWWYDWIVIGEGETWVFLGYSNSDLYSTSVNPVIYAISCHYDDVRMGEIASQITSLTIVYSIVYSDADQRKHQTPRHWPLCGECTGDRWIPRTNGQLRGKYFHLMTSSFYTWPQKNGIWLYPMLSADFRFWLVNSCEI